MSDAMYNLIYIIDNLCDIVFRFGLLYLFYKYIEVRRTKA